MSQYSDAFCMLPPVAFLIMLSLGYAFYLAGKVLAPKTKKSAGKMASYSCGEDIPGGRLKQKYNQFHIAFFFTMLHVGALMIATLPAVDAGDDVVNAAFVGLIYLMGMAFVVMTLIAGGADRA